MSLPAVDEGRREEPEPEPRCRRSTHSLSRPPVTLLDTSHTNHPTPDQLLIAIHTITVSIHHSPSQSTFTPTQCRCPSRPLSPSGSISSEHGSCCVALPRRVCRHRCDNRCCDGSVGRVGVWYVSCSSTIALVFAHRCAPTRRSRSALGLTCALHLASTPHLRTSAPDHPRTSRSLTNSARPQHRCHPLSRRERAWCVHPAASTTRPLHLSLNASPVAVISLTPVLVHTLPFATYLLLAQTDAPKHKGSLFLPFSPCAYRFALLSGCSLRCTGPEQNTCADTQHDTSASSSPCRRISAQRLSSCPSMSPLSSASAGSCGRRRPCQATRTLYLSMPRRDGGGKDTQGTSGGSAPPGLTTRPPASLSDA